MNVFADQGVLRHPFCMGATQQAQKKSLTIFDQGFFYWLRGPDLNQRPLGYEPNELPDCSTSR